MSRYKDYVGKKISKGLSYFRSKKDWFPKNSKSPKRTHLFNVNKIDEEYKKTFQALPELEPIPLDDLPFSLLGISPEKIKF